MARVTTPGSVVFVLLFALSAASAPARGQVLCRTEADDVAALRSFNAAVTAYVELHRRLDARLSPLQFSSDPELVARGVMELADSIRAARPDAARGDIFTPEVADLFRVRMAASAAAREADDEAWFASDEEGGFCAPLPEVNSSFTWEGSTAVYDFARVLPALPLELDYRLVDHALVVIDVPANLVVDVLDSAIQ